MSEKKEEGGGTPLNTLKIQFIMRSNYDTLQNLIDKHLDDVDKCLGPLLDEILDAELEENISAMKKIFRKISIYIVLSSGLGNPALIMNLKESMAALESVFALEELTDFLSLARTERQERLDELLELTSGVRLFNRDCKKSGEMLPDLPFDLVDSGKACLSSLSHSLISAMQRVNLLTTAVEDRMVIDEDTGKVVVDVQTHLGLTNEHYNQIFGLLIFNRQYEIYIRRLLSDMQVMEETSKDLVEKYKQALENIHGAVKYKTAVPCDTVFPLFRVLWGVWRAMQNTMYLVSTVSRLMVILKSIQEHNKIPYSIVDKMLAGKTVCADEERSILNVELSSLQILSSSHTENDPAEKASSMINPESSDAKGTQMAFLNFCTMCLNVGALVPSNQKIGLIRHKRFRYGFSSMKMAAKFTKSPERYINETLNYARNNPQIINLLGMEAQVKAVRDIEPLVMSYLPKITVNNKDVQTLVHPVEEYIEHNYSWDLWEWKRRACQWANIVKCQTHSTQTNYSHLRSEIHCQTVEPRDKCLQTMKEAGINTNTCNFFFWGLRGQIGDGQHLMDMVPKHKPEKPSAKPVVRCLWPCKEKPATSHLSLRSEIGKDDNDDDILQTYYVPAVKPK